MDKKMDKQQRYLAVEMGGLSEDKNDDNHLIL